MSWFVINNENVTGPFSTDEVLGLKNQDEFDSNETYVWGAQIDYWLKFPEWVESYPSILSNSSQRAQEKVQTWYYAENSKTKPLGPYDKETLISLIREHEKKEKILVWTKGMEAWASVFEFSDILSELNISRRKHPRAPIEGQVTLTDKDGNSFIGRIDILSPGGCGVSQMSHLVRGQSYQIEIKSEALYNPISAVGVILREIGENKFGIRFEKISVESRSTIISYLKEQGYIKQGREAA